MEIKASPKNKYKRIPLFLNDILLLIIAKNKKPINNKSVKYKKTESHSLPCQEIVARNCRGIKKRKA
ncbi:MAG: hypothetical protein A2V69_00630 [Candidatus Portnoybacteria bacterium RBG_13_40_8]|uniref:Uncharacterized protein n=1 Tax=Candidatus Portnoybacteria bacterium RBG_13_40_8 TaxID=1801990 RepID=A0A1G2F459_9BACT|nr:MAG: hypothetical protein A2V69_00630 [Candidatus Portnoybacteria bacterium RBG_13_40_8]